MATWAYEGFVAYLASHQGASAHDFYCPLDLGSEGVFPRSLSKHITCSIFERYINVHFQKARLLKSALSVHLEHILENVFLKMYSNVHERTLWELIVPSEPVSGQFFF